MGIRVAYGTAPSRRVNSAFELLKVRNSHSEYLRYSMPSRDGVITLEVDVEG